MATSWLCGAAMNPTEAKKAAQTRLRRLEGQVRGIQRMLDEERTCQEVLTQLAAVRSALQAVDELVLEMYLAHCQADFAQGKGNPQDLLNVLRLARS